MADDQNDLSNKELMRRMLTLGIGGALGAGGGDASGNASNYLPNITNPAPTDNGHAGAPGIATGLAIPATTIPEDTSTPPPGAIAPIIDNSPSSPEHDMYTGNLYRQAPVITQPTSTTLPVIQQGNAPDSPELMQRLAAQDYATPPPAIAPGAPIQTGNAYRPEGVFGPGQARNIGGLGTQIADSSGVTTGLPNIAPGAAAVTPASGLLSDQQKLADLYHKQDEYHPGVWHQKDHPEITSSDPKKANDPNWVQDVAPGTARKKNWSTWDKIGNALLGWAQGGIVGGIRGATDRNFFRKMQDQQQMAELLPRIQAQQGIALRNAQVTNEAAKQGQETARLRNAWNIAKDAHDATINAAKIRAQGTADEWKEHIDPDTGEVSKEYTKGNRAMDPLYDANGKRVIDPRYSWYDPISKQTIKLGGKEYATAQGPVIAGQLTRDQAAITETAKLQQAANLDYAGRLDAWNKVVTERNTKVVEALANSNMYGQAATDAAKQLWLIQQEIDKLQDSPVDPNAKEGVITQRNAQIEDLQKQYREAGGKMNEAMRQSDAGKAYLSQAGFTIPDKPVYVKPTAVTAVQVGTGKSVPKSKDPLGILR